MKKYLFLLFLVGATAAHADPFAGGHADNGKKLFDKYNCNSCHKAKVGGDGSAIFTRPDSIIPTANLLIPRITFCSGVVGANLTDQEKLDLAAYLNQNYYHFK
jgi:cytochrome c